MNERNYGVLPIFLSLVALVISAFPFFLPPLARSGVISYECFKLILPWGWILGFILALSSLNMVSGSRGLLRKIAVWVFSLLTITEAMIWASLAIDMLVHKPL
jgi:hypothetical protein